MSILLPRKDHVKHKYGRKYFHIKRTDIFLGLMNSCHMIWLILHIPMLHVFPLQLDENNSTFCNTLSYKNIYTTPSQSYWIIKVELLLLRFLWRHSSYVHKSIKTCNISNQYNKDKKPYRQECAIFCLKVWGVLSRLCSCPCKSPWLYIGLSTQYLWVCSRHASCSWECSIVDLTEEEPGKNSSTVSTGKHCCKQNKLGYFFNLRFGISFQIIYFDKLVTRTVNAAQKH